MTAANPLAVVGVGLVSSVGQTAEAGCAAIRCGVNNFQETPFVGRDGEPIIGSTVSLEAPWRGTAKLAKMAARAIAECCASAENETLANIPVLLGIAEAERPGRPEALGRVILEAIEQELGIRLHPHSRVIEQGRVGSAVALLQARRLLLGGRHRVIVAGVDSFLTGASLAAYDREDRLLRRGNANGFIPGEAAGAALLAAWNERTSTPLLVRGLGFGLEPAPFDSGRPLRGDGLVRAIRAALGDADVALKDCDHRIADMNGEQYRFKEAALAITRILRDRKVLFSLWHPADSIGEVGAATLPAMLAMLYYGARKDYLPGPMFLGHLGNDDDKRSAFVTQALGAQTLALEVAAETDYRRERGIGG